MHASLSSRVFDSNLEMPTAKPMPQKSHIFIRLQSEMTLFGDLLLHISRDRSQQRLELDGFLDEMLRADLKSLPADPLTGSHDERGDDSKLRLCKLPLPEFPPIHDGHHEIQDDQIRLSRPRIQSFQGLF